ncbi:DEAD/DEAH box helicase [Pediococcus inopinatus]|uniref:DEAD-box ATP-dependent RNA helicase CshA n=1 Tax=Pediococcus inopinatus TaxID=114090 RepID=A0ABZ0Q380_9LACO|nr:DEAD/DEAH box helicase [Pediococcus inopinatus]AVL00531.1 ATP-dependent RNA helicase [Pediococcus inopinatus]KRN59658.1 ATP-dependent RNA helicase DeaD [Pediococcus inopinatus]WPC17150.1 DEAD/DEAH box helicase [Pediococcus inopinatus]WPC19730.1 DEAD/DEAH box helicase [Pediococcus inopinatus]WPC21426.1 DEAD/DEAH box helicase [Pediococcus inopinatus]
MKFTDFELSDELQKTIAESGFTEPTPIQAQTIPHVLAGKDIIGQAQTGTGKTAAFGLPILEHVDVNNPNVQALVVSPTRELAIQTQEELYRLGREKHVKVQVVYGGADIRRQIKNLKSHPQIIVGTPGRLLDHIRRHTIKLENVQTLVLDEADDMLDMGFLPDIESIISETPSSRQTLLFSATMPPAMKKIGVKFMTDPEQITVKSKELTTDLVDQYYIKSKEFEKFDMLTRILDVQTPKLALVFGRTKRRVDEVSRGLEARGYNAAGIHGDLTQQRRSSILQKFRNGQVSILVATDVAARGLDISGVTHVYNYDIPQDPDSYVHRIGRTGRAGAHGVSVTFVTPWEMDYLRDVEKLTKKRLLPLKPPTDAEAFQGRVTIAEKAIDDLVKGTKEDQFSDQTKELLEKYTPEQLAAALLNSETKTDSSQVKVKITPERPLPNHKGGKGHNGGGHRGGGYRGNNKRRSNSSSSYRGGRGDSRDSRGKSSDRGHSNYKKNNSSSNGSNNGGNRHSSSNRKFTIREHN